MSSVIAIPKTLIEEETTACELPRRRAYIAGPMRSKPEFNYPEFMRAAEALRARGWEVFNPAEMDKEEDGIDYSEQGLSLSEQHEMASKYENARRFAKRDLLILIDELRAENGDAIVMLPDWVYSTGATAERAAARWVGLAVLNLDEALEEGGYWRCVNQ